MHLTERFRRIDFGHMKVEITVDDPRNYTKPFTVKSNQILRADTDLLEFVCLENEKDANHYSGRCVTRRQDESFASSPRPDCQRLFASPSADLNRGNSFSALVRSRCCNSA